MEKQYKLPIRALKGVLLPVIIAMSLFVSCFWEHHHHNTQEESRTVLIYIAADNNLSRFVNMNISQMRYAAKSFPENSNLIAYVDKQNIPPMLLHITYNSVDTISVYEELNSADPSTLSMVIDEVKTRWKAEHYGLVLWSHGMGWVPTSQLHNVASVMGYAPSRDSGRDNSPLYEKHPDVRDMFAPETKGFGFERFPDDDSPYSSMDVNELAEAIPDDLFEFIIFDTCYMGCVELAYAFRNKADWFVSSSCEILGQGFPYHELTVDIMKADMMSVCRKYFEHYDKEIGFDRLGTISLVDCSALDELADCFSKIVAQIDDYSSLDEDSIQHLDRFWPNHVFFDMVDLVEHVCTDRELLDEFRILTKKSIPYSASTPFIFEGELYEIPIEKFCGLSMYYPFGDNEELKSEYRKLEWSIKTGYTDYVQIIRGD
ncbi:MAG: hypothetical protein IKS24_09950 [Bacteroidaceae bacterium]|nr:hypothetical protein [Bacteroidaceae bacterium]